MTKKEFKELTKRIRNDYDNYCDALREHDLDVDFVINKSYETAHKYEITYYFENMNFNGDFKSSKFNELDYSKIKATKGDLLDYLYNQYLDIDNEFCNLFYWPDLGEFLYDELKNI